MPERKTDLSVLTSRSRLPAALATASGMQKLDWILGLPKPEEFVAALAPTELYHWLRDIGKEDAYPLLQWANDEQLKGLVDIDAWNRHELSIPRWLDWLDLALAVDTDTAEHFITAQDDVLLLWLVTGPLQVLPNDTDINEIPDELAFFSTPDFLYLVTVPRDHPLEERLPQLMKLFWSADIDRAREVFQQAMVELHERAGDELERFRDARLQDLGLESHSDAISVYEVQPIRLLRAELEALGNEPEPAPAPEPEYAPTRMVNDLILRGVEPPDLLRAAVSALDERDRVTFGNGFAYLANKVFMAESGDLSRVDDLPDAAKQAAALANLGLSYLARESEERASTIVRQLTPEMLFKTGWTLVFDLGRKARRLAARAGQDRGYDLFGDPTDDVIRAAALLRPRHAEGWFSTLADLARVEAHVEEANVVLGAFEDHFGLTLTALDEGDLPGLSDDARERIRLTTLVRTGLAHALLSDEFSFTPLDRETLVAFSRAAFLPDGNLSAEFRGRIAFLIETTAASMDEGRGEAAREAFKNLVLRAVDELIEALGNVAERDLDLRYAGEVFLVVT